LPTFTGSDTKAEQLSKYDFFLQEGVLIEKQFRKGTLVSESEKSFLNFSKI